jgi:hypothetical protein
MPAAGGGADDCVAHPCSSRVGGDDRLPGAACFQIEREPTCVPRPASGASVAARAALRACATTSWPPDISASAAARPKPSVGPVTMFWLAAVVPGLGSWVLQVLPWGAGWVGG